jgi:hypothetical protein
VVACGAVRIAGLSAFFIGLGSPLPPASLPPTSPPTTPPDPALVRFAGSVLGKKV